MGPMAPQITSLWNIHRISHRQLIEYHTFTATSQCKQFKYIKQYCMSADLYIYVHMVCKAIHIRTDHPGKIYNVHLLSWWRHQMETFSALVAICAGNSPVTGEFPSHRPVTRSFDVFVDIRPNKQLSKQSRGWWFETPSRPLCVIVMFIKVTLLTYRELHSLPFFHCQNPGLLYYCRNDIMFSRNADLSVTKTKPWFSSSSHRK